MRPLLTPCRAYRFLAALLVAFGLPAIAANSATAQQHDAAETITVELASGRTFTATVDARTDRQRLWLRWQQGSAAVLRPVEWDQVARARVAGHVVTTTELQDIVKTIRRNIPLRPENSASDKRLVLRGDVNRARGIAQGAADTAVAAAPESAPPRVRCLAIEAEVARWEANVEADGLLVRVYPLDEFGGVVPVSGTLQVELIGQQSGGLKPADPFFSAAHWELGVRPPDFNGGGAVVRLQFQSVQPEFDLCIAPRGAVHAILSVPGQGTFEATAGMVRIRPYSSVRDELQQATGHRFFPQETTGDGRR